MAETDWTLEIAKLVVGSLTPISVGVLGWYLNKRLKMLEDLQWKSRKIIEKRIEIFDKIAPLLNQLYCYYTWVGDWSTTKPPDVLDLKRRLDRIFFVYEGIFSRAISRRYRALIGSMFETYNAPGVSAKIKSRIVGPDGDRRTSPNFEWEPGWDAMFSDEVTPEDDVREVYWALMEEMGKSLGL